MKNSKASLYVALLSFAVMGVVDLTGAAVGFVKTKFELTESMAQFLPTMVFIHFFLWSVPAGLWQNKYGRKRILAIASILTGVSLLVPFTVYTFPIMLVAFTLLGFSNTLIQVSANPLIGDVSKPENQASNLSLGQFIKAIISFAGPLLAAASVTYFNDWRGVLLIFAVMSLAQGLALFGTPIKERDAGTDKKTTFGSAFALLKNRHSALMVLGIFLVVGIDVGINANIAGYVENKFNFTMEQATINISYYFAALTVGRFLGAILLRRWKEGPFIVGSTIITIAAGIGIMWAPTYEMLLVFLILFGLASANFFPLFFTAGLKKQPTKVNELSGLMIMAVSGGGVVPPLMGWLTTTGGYTSAFAFLTACVVALLLLGFYHMAAVKKPE